MVTHTYDGTYRSDAYQADAAVTERAAYRDVGATIFLWVAWTLAFAFWAFFMSSFFGILRDIAAAGPGTLMGGVDMSGGGYAFMDVIGGVVILGLVLIYGMARYATRDKAMDPITEAATRDLYDHAGR
jgi:hypothetical protein